MRDGKHRICGGTVSSSSSNAAAARACRRACCGSERQQIWPRQARRLPLRLEFEVAGHELFEKSCDTSTVQWAEPTRVFCLQQSMRGRHSMFASFFEGCVESSCALWLIASCGASTWSVLYQRWSSQFLEWETNSAKQISDEMLAMRFRLV